MCIRDRDQKERMLSRLLHVTKVAAGSVVKYKPYAAIPCVIARGLMTRRLNTSQFENICGYMRRFSVINDHSSAKDEKALVRLEERKVPQSNPEINAAIKSDLKETPIVLACQCKTKTAMLKCGHNICTDCAARIRRNIEWNKNKAKCPQCLSLIHI
eukprot:TRINITY_DN249_c0_g2_i1.p1 TRINITY_DN249_c0_g2~~TRINITY_DN249_c0_g2_i1.p1  ORF type:complete len:172 (+),score=42.64 TRINITY_DN249_c0_g2_i1:48-518(+)